LTGKHFLLKGCVEGIKWFFQGIDDTGDFSVQLADFFAFLDPEYLQILAIDEAENNLLDAFIFPPITGIAVTPVEFTDRFDIDNGAFKIRDDFFPVLLYQTMLLC
jgi:hypothetical protein